MNIQLEQFGMHEQSSESHDIAENHTRWRTIWLSDVHLGTRGCKSTILLDFLRHNESEYLYLVGDIIDGWRLKKSWLWTPEHNTTIQKLLRKVRKGTKTYFLPGNHDEFARDYLGLNIGGVEIFNEMIHETADGRKLLILHGDKFDGVMKYAKWLAYVGDTAYELALRLNAGLSYCRRKLGLPYWSLSSYLKHKVKNAVNFISDFETSLAAEARFRGADGIVCGHIHHPQMREIDGVLYCNDGDWVESCSALVEDFEGNLQIIYWRPTNLTTTN